MRDRPGSIKALFWKVFIRARWFFSFSGKKGAEIGARTPDFRLQDLSGRSFTLSDAFPKKAAVLWLTNLCSGCEERIQLLERIYEANRDRLEVFVQAAIAVFVENALIVSMVRAHLDRRVISYRIALERLVIMTPSPQAVDAERALNQLRGQIARYRGHLPPTWQREQSLAAVR